MITALYTDSTDTLLQFLAKHISVILKYIHDWNFYCTWSLVTPLHSLTHQSVSH